MTTHRTADVAVVGLGAIGLPVSINAVGAGLRVQVWNRSASQAARAAERGAMVAPTLDEIDAPVVLTVLPDAPELEEVLAAGLEQALRPDDLLVVLSTLAPEAMQRLAVRLGPSGIHVVDAPVSGGDVGAQQGTLAIMVGGDAADVDRCRPVLASFGSRIEHLGPLGAGQIAKACNQIIVGATLAAIGEALAIGRAAGLEDEQLLNVLSAGMAGSRAMEIKSEKYLSGDYAPGGSVANQLKDLRIALAAGANLGFRLPLTSRVADVYQGMADSGRSRLDHSAVVLAAMESRTLD